MNKAFYWLAKLAVGKHLIKAVAVLHDSLDGKRSQISIALLVIVHILKIAGVLDESTTKKIEESLLVILPITMADKASKWIKTADGIIPNEKLENKITG